MSGTCQAVHCQISTAVDAAGSRRLCCHTFNGQLACTRFTATVRH